MGRFLVKKESIFSTDFSGSIYLNGGVAETFSIVEEYNPATDAWTTKSPMPTARGGFVTGVVNEKIYAIGGGDVYPPSNLYRIVEEYNPVTDTWTSKSKPDVGPLNAACGVVNGKIYVIGGFGSDRSNPFASVYVYDPAVETFSE